MLWYNKGNKKSDKKTNSYRYRVTQIALVYSAFHIRIHERVSNVKAEEQEMSVLAFLLSSDCSLINLLSVLKNSDTYKK